MTDLVLSTNFVAPSAGSFGQKQTEQWWAVLRGSNVILFFSGDPGSLFAMPFF